MTSTTLSEGKQHGSTYALLVSLVMIIGGLPFAVNSDWLSGAYAVLMTAVILSGLWGISHRRRLFWIVSPVGTLAVLMLWLSFVTQSVLVAATSFSMGLIVVVLVGVVVLADIVQSPRITASSVSGGVAGYLLMGLAWAYSFALLELFAPGSFLRRGDALAGGERGLQELLYYAFVALSTLGFGDITPVTPPAEGFSILASVTGQLYIAILIAALVGRMAVGGSESRD